MRLESEESCGSFQILDEHDGFAKLSVDPKCYKANWETVLAKSVRRLAEYHRSSSRAGAICNPSSCWTCL